MRVRRTLRCIRSFLSVGLLGAASGLFSTPIPAAAAAHVDSSLTANPGSIDMSAMEFPYGPGNEHFIDIACADAMQHLQKVTHPEFSGNSRFLRAPATRI